MEQRQQFLKILRESRNTYREVEEPVLQRMH